tara:strand:- start:331 stop:747 length:417 start_codon:yes stop_codon:yes gene_type:complete
MIDINKLKKGDRVQFGKDTFAMVTNFEDDISNLKGAINSIDNKGECIWVKLDKPNRHFEDYNNCVQFSLVEEGSGSHISYLKKSDLLFNYEIEQSYIQTDTWKNVEAKDKQEAVNICMGGRSIDETRQDETETSIKKI